MIRKLLRAGAYAGFLVAVVLVGSEIFLRFLLPAPQRYFIWPANYRANFEPREAATPGISGTGRFIVNSLGIRSDEPPADRARTIYVLGGSTAADVYLDQDEAWAQLVQTKLNATPSQPKTWVGNLSRSSLATLHNLLIFEHLLPSLPKPDLVVNLVGVNDLQLALKSSYLRDMDLDTHMRWTFSAMPSQGPWWEHLATVRFYRRIHDWLSRSKEAKVQTFNADGFVTWRACRQKAPADRLVGELPDLSRALATYRENLNRIADRTAQFGARILFVTQPTLWADPMSPENAAILLAGGVGPNNEWCDEQRYFSPKALAEGMARFNAVLLEVCSERKLACLDLASRMPKSREYFYDDMHFNEAGARFVADAVSEAIRTLGPMATGAGNAR